MIFDTWDDLAEYYVNEGFKETGYHDDEDPYSSGFGRRIYLGSLDLEIKKRQSIAM
jgi:hypothetical protein